MSYSTEDNLTVSLRENKDGTYNLNDLKKYKQAEAVKEQIHYFDENQKVYLHHSEMRSGYVTRAKGCYVKKYNGKHGVGYIVDIPNFQNHKTFERRFYLFKENETNETAFEVTAES